MMQSKSIPVDFDFDAFIGAEIISTQKDRIVGRLDVGQQHLTKGDRVHGGLIIALAETLAGHGAILNMPLGCKTTTIELKTNFMNPGHLGAIYGVAVPLHIGRTTMVWQINIYDKSDRHLAAVQQTQIVFEDDQSDTPAALETDTGKPIDAPGIGLVSGHEKPVKLSTTEQRRAQILAAAFPLISDKGFAQTSVREIASAAGMSVPAVYKYVSNKDEILEMIFQDYILQTGTKVSSAAKISGDTTEKLREAIGASMSELDKHRSKVRMMYRESRSLRSEVRERVKNQGQHYIELFQEILEEGVKDGSFNNIDTKLVASMIPMLCEVWVLRPWSVSSIGLEKVRDGIIDLVLNGIGSNGRT